MADLNHRHRQAQLMSDGTPSHLSTSPSSSFSSSVASSMLQSAVAPSNYSQSDIVTSDEAGWEPPKKKFNNSLIRPSPRTSSLNIGMGQTPSREPQFSSPTSPTSQLASRGFIAAANTGMKLKRAFAGRRKKSEDLLASPGPTPQAATRLKQRDVGEGYVNNLHEQTRAQIQYEDVASRKGLSLQMAFNGKKNSKPLPSTPPPTPKPVHLRAPPQKVDKLATPEADYRSQTRGSIIPVTPSMTSALNYMRLDDRQKEIVNRDETDAVDRNRDKEKWRKSDSAMSHHTLRPNASPRSPRPVSMAESLQSTSTVVQVGRRLSAVVTEAEFSMAVEDFSLKDPPGSAGNRRGLSPSSSIKAKNRRSMSLNLGPSLGLKSSEPSTSMSPTEVKSQSVRIRSPSDAHPLSPSISRETPTLTRADANGIISPSATDPQSTGNKLRGRLAALTAANANTPHPSSSPDRWQLQQASVQAQRPSMNAQLKPLRQTAISITGSFAPAAGLARRAVEKMGRAWGISSSLGSGHSSASSGTPPSSYSSLPVHPLGRTESETSVQSLNAAAIAMRRTPQAPSGSWSVASSSATLSSDPDAYVSSAPVLGNCLRGPMRLTSSGAGGGFVFGVDLVTCTRETAVEAVRNVIATGKFPLDQAEVTRKRGSTSKESILKALDNRVVPAIVVRCAQHLILYGLQEEGLFRVTGRPSHVSKLRLEFDSGADYDMSDCTPGDLDPHAVASIFKAYLRELPEPILTHALLPYFDAAMNAESSAIPEVSRLSRSARGPGLPSGPKGGTMPLRKPPSLSTLAMPNFTGMRPPSNNLLSAFKALISRLPRENRDLIRTVADLITATAKQSKETKMPLSNLLLVFCPSLNMNPPLLRVLCENESIWGDLDPEDSPVLDIKRNSKVLDISPSAGRRADDSESSEGDHVQEAKPTASEPRQSESDPLNSTDGVDGAVAESMTSEETWSSLRPRRTGARRPPVQTLYLDSESLMDGSKSGSGDAASLRDCESYSSPSESLSIASHRPPPLTSSSESLITPSSSSRGPSVHDIPLVNESHPKPSPSQTEYSEAANAGELSRFAASTPMKSGLVTFPLGGARPSKVSRRRSIPLLSLPSPDTSLDPFPDILASSSSRRINKTSIHRLFGRRSESPLSSATLSACTIDLESKSDTPSSSSTPRSMVTAPQSSPYISPPVLDTRIDSSPLSISLGDNTVSHRLVHDHARKMNSEQHLELSDTEGSTGYERRDTFGVKVGPSSLDNVNQTHDEFVASASTGAVVTGQTPIADLFRSPSSASIYSLVALQDTQPLRPRKKASAVSFASSNHLGELPAGDDSEDDWTRSVLMAADVEGAWDFKGVT